MHKEIFLKECVDGARVVYNPYKYEDLPITRERIPMDMPDEILDSGIDEEKIRRKLCLVRIDNLEKRLILFNNKFGKNIIKFNELFNIDASMCIAHKELVENYYHFNNSITLSVPKSCGVAVIETKTKNGISIQNTVIIYGKEEKEMYKVLTVPVVIRFPKVFMDKYTIEDIATMEFIIHTYEYMIEYHIKNKN